MRALPKCPSCDKQNWAFGTTETNWREIEQINDDGSIDEGQKLILGDVEELDYPFLCMSCKREYSWRDLFDE